MVEFLTELLLVARSKLKSRARLEAENIVLRQQMIVLSRTEMHDAAYPHERLGRGCGFGTFDRLLFVWMYRLFPSILDAITIVKPDTVIRWHQRDSARTGGGNRAAAVAAQGSTAKFVI